jgi:hypothetical protein
MTEELLRAIFVALESEQVRYAIFGGIAMGAHGLPRATKDLDLFLDPEPGNVDAAKRALARALADPAIAEIEATDLEQYGLVRYGLPDHDFLVDLTARIGEAFSFDRLETQRSTLLGVPVTVVTPRELVRMKRSTGRPQDQGDVVRLRDRFAIEGD